MPYSPSQFAAAAGVSPCGRTRLQRLCRIVCFIAPIFAASAVADDVSLHSAIDQRIEAAIPDYLQRSADVCEDAEFVRRVHLDLTGRIPAVPVVREFLANDAADKRAQLVERLLASPEHARHLQLHFDVMLMQRLPRKHIDPVAWQDYLYSSFRDNKPWDQLAREILSADGTEKETGPAVRFLMDRDLKREETTRILGRAFLGRDMECAQCHDHPQIDDYAQRHYYGLSAFFSRSYVFTDPKTKTKLIGEKAEGAVKFTSVFTSIEAETPPRILDLPELPDPEPDKDPYVAKPDKNTRGVPKHSRRQLLAAAMTDPANRAFQLNIANRLWALVMGRGLVEPLDMFHSANPPSHPQLLDLLADDLVRHDYDMRRTIREISLSRTYQLSSRLKQADAADEQSYLAGLLKPLTPEQLAWSVMTATGVVDAARSSAVAQLAKEMPDLKAGTAEHEVRVEAAINKALSANVNEFVSVFASTNESSRFDSTAGQALFVLNGTLIGNWLKPNGGNLMARLQSPADSRVVADELFLAFLSRPASVAEVDALQELESISGNDRISALKLAARSILGSAEFRFNH